MKYKVVGWLDLIFGSVGLIQQILMLFFVYPKLNTLYQDFNAQLPLFTRIYPYLVVVAAIVSAGIIFLGMKLAFSKTPSNKLFKLGTITLIVILLLGILNIFSSMLSVISPIYSLSSLPPEKQAIEDRLAKERAAGYANPAPKNLISPPASSPDPTLELKQYRNDQFGFSFNYYYDLSPDMDWVSVSSDTANFSSSLNNGAYSENLKYDKFNNKWIVSPDPGEPVDEIFCPIENFTVLQHLPYYQVADFRTGRPWYYAYVTKAGIIVISSSDPFHHINDSVKFDHPNEVIKVACEISKQ